LVKKGTSNEVLFLNYEEFILIKEKFVRFQTRKNTTIIAANFLIEKSKSFFDPCCRMADHLYYPVNTSCISLSLRKMVYENTDV